MAGAGVRDLLIEGPWQHHDIAANGIRFHLAAGRSLAPDRPLVLLLHGFGEFWWAWRHQIPALDEAGFAVAALDLRGYGASDKTPRGYDPLTTAGDIAGVIRSLGHGTAVLVGHDWGGIAAWSTVAYAPAQVRGLVSVAAPHPLAYPWRHGLRDLAFFQIPLLPERRIMAEDGAFIENLHRSRTAPASLFPNAAEARRYRDALMLWPSPHCALEYQRSFVRNQVRSAGRSYRRALHATFAGPVLSVHGQLDPIVPLAAMAAAGPYIDGPHTVIDLPRVGHLPHEEAPELFTAALLQWLEQRS
ncbi:alpha/beta hydrolase [Microlunatus panaciterrae]|uniref:Pimeloyl-ACP methyl ester carboxylesterase n=1 Tax=Microlunatus panaciterrae TaxID=400768 RepID=A0ABS2RL42_9ACTN|nr:alpha/beta hydrolase [Microlunatus panaciterrae]MBM7799207.1 pimeloyl-ACP methyl ester carboxylesterase [Microlunatus panaciterrae]